MAFQFYRLRRAVTSFSASQRSLSSSSSVSLAGEKKYKLYKEGDEITEDTVLFEGCDFNHWLITVDFPKDPAPSPEEMVATYERICAQGLGVSIEEANQKMYACSTTTYQGFQTIMTENESEKFKDVPGVLFVLPDSYIDPVNKEYGGDKYENGVITHRPPPVQYRRNDRSRQQGSRRYGQQGNPDFRQQGYPQHQQQGPMRGDNRNNGPPQNFPSQQQFGAPPPPQNYPQQSFGAQSRQNFGAPQNNSGASQQSFGAQSEQNFGAPRNNYGAPQQNFGALPNNYGSGQQNYPPHGGQIPLNDKAKDSQGQQGNYYHPAQGGNYGPPGQRDPRGDGGNYSPMNGGTYRQGANVSTGRGHPGEVQGFSQMDQRNTQEGREDYSPMGQPGTDQVRGGRY